MKCIIFRNTSVGREYLTGNHEFSKCRDAAYIWPSMGDAWAMLEGLQDASYEIVSFNTPYPLSSKDTIFDRIEKASIHIVDYLNSEERSSINLNVINTIIYNCVISPQ